MKKAYGCRYVHYRQTNSGYSIHFAHITILDSINGGDCVAGEIDFARAGAFSSKTVRPTLEIFSNP